MPNRSRWLATILPAVVAAVLAITAPVSATPDEPSAGAAKPTADRVTLITGDVVEVVQAAPGRYAASVQPAPGRESVTFHTAEVDGGLLVVPSDVVPYLSAGVLDQRLFDVPQLIAEGYDDASMPRLPLIVRHDGEVATGPGAMSAGTALDSIDGVALAPGKGELGEFWQSISEPPGAQARAAAEPALAGGIAEIWLDGRVTPALDRSVAQIGAPAAWDEGYDGSGVTVAVLDTGVDDAHPDLAGKIATAQNFSDSPTLADSFGHGTHVAATAVGSGAAADGARRGVAPGATLLAGKVLNDAGFGFESWIIAGMEWAVAEGADVVNLSLGGDPTDGTDPMSQAVDRLSKESGALFVISAGNSGTDYSVGSPGAATAALTVGAVDRDDMLADFSSRGPRVGDNASKPEITAPGVEIVAARAAGTAMGRPIDEHYTAASGTSMAAPHVAGAAALLAQANPDWDGDQLKDALVSTADPQPDLGVHEQGGGRVDVGRAVAQRLHATGVVDFGLHVQPDSSGPPVDARLSYTNGTDRAVTLELSVDFTNLDQSASAGDAVLLDADRVTVPAGATVEVPVQLDLAQLARGRHAGRIIATAPGGVVVRTTIAATLAGPTYSVTFRAVDAEGRPTGVDLLALRGSEPRTDHPWWWFGEGQQLTLEVEEGTYLLHSLIPDFNPQFEQAYLITDPELEVTGDMEVVLDARAAVPVRIETPKPAEQRAVFSYYVHREMHNERQVSFGVMHFSTVRQLNVTPTEPVTGGEYEFSSRWQLVTPLVTASVPGMVGDVEMNLLHESPVFDGPRQLNLVWAGTGTPDELVAADVSGAVALLEASEDRFEQEQVAAAADAGAAAAVIVRSSIDSPWTVWRPIGDREPIPAMVMAHDGGQQLITHARTRGGRAPIRLTMAESSPYLFDVMHVETERVPEQIVHRVTEANSARFTVGYADTGGFDWLKEQRFGWRPWQGFAWNDAQRFTRAGASREEWVSAGDTIWQHLVQHEYTWNDIGPLVGGMTEAPRSYTAGRAADTTWFGPVVRPAAPQGVAGMVSSRTGDMLALRVPEFVDAEPGHFAFADEFSDHVEARVLRDGEVIAELPDAWRDVSTTAGPASYRLELTTERESDEWAWATRTETSWEFRSQRPDGTEPLPLLQVDYDVPADLSGRVPGRHPHRLGLSVRHQDGMPAPHVDEVRLEVSFDEGGSWRTVPVREFGRRLVADVPAGQGTVSLRVSARDAGGSAVTQTVIRAYGLR